MMTFMIQHYLRFTYISVQANAMATSLSDVVLANSMCQLLFHAQHKYVVTNQQDVSAERYRLQQMLLQLSRAATEPQSRALILHLNKSPTLTAASSIDYSYSLVTHSEEAAFCHFTPCKWEGTLNGFKWNSSALTTAVRSGSIITLYYPGLDFQKVTPESAT